jgi:hypothetical protein
VWNDFRFRELNRGKSGDLTAEFDALFKLSVPTELDALVRISVSDLSVARLPLLHTHFLFSSQAPRPKLDPLLCSFACDFAMVFDGIWHFRRYRTHQTA